MRTRVLQMATGCPSERYTYHGLARCSTMEVQVDIYMAQPMKRTRRPTYSSQVNIVELPLYLHPHERSGFRG